MNSQFYLTLPSNTEKDGTASNFRVKLPNKIKLEGDWEVGLAEIIYPYSWYNISSRDQNNMIYIKLSNVNGKKYIFDKVYILPGYYESIFVLIKAINDAIKAKPIYNNGEKLLVEYGYNESTRKVFVTVDPNHVVFIMLSSRLREMFGFPEDNYGYQRKSNHVYPHVSRAIKPPDLSSHIETLYIYCDVIENQIVGSTLAPLLRIIDVNGNFGEIINKAFDNPHYVPLLTKDINFIEINIKNDMNDLIIYEFGKVIVKLHFRKSSRF